MGVEPARISDILLTHVHTDHSGGLVRDGKARFPNATVHVGEGDVDFFLARENQQGVDGYDKAYFEQATLSLSPYVTAGRIKPFSGVTELVPGITAVLTPGHSFFHVESHDHLRRRQRRGEAAAAGAVPPPRARARGGGRRAHALPRHRSRTRRGPGLRVRARRSLDRDGL